METGTDVKCTRELRLFFVYFGEDWVSEFLSEDELIKRIYSGNCNSWVEDIGGLWLVGESLAHILDEPHDEDETEGIHSETELGLTATTQKNHEWIEPGETIRRLLEIASVDKYFKEELKNEEAIDDFPPHFLGSVFFNEDSEEYETDDEETDDTATEKENQDDEERDQHLKLGLDKFFDHV